MEQSEINIGVVRFEHLPSLTPESIRQPGPAPSPPVMISHYPIGDRQQPGSRWLTNRYVLEPAPGDGKYLGGSIFTVGEAEPPEAVPINGEIVVGKERVEFISQVDILR